MATWQNKKAKSGLCKVERKKENKTGEDYDTGLWFFQKVINSLRQDLQQNYKNAIS